MSYEYRLKNQDVVRVEKTPFNSGGEGKVYKVVKTPQFTHHCVKIYDHKYRTSEREHKLQYMVHNPPSSLEGEHYMVCWPVDVLYDKEEFIGFVMPMAFENSIQLYEICTLSLRKKLTQEWHKFDRGNNSNNIIRLKLCVNIALAIHNVHSIQHYVLVDMKPQNILASPDGKVSIIDLDSIQIYKGNQVIYRSSVATPEYVPPESHSLSPSNDFIPVSWDRFSIAVIFYEILFGIHPYASTASGNYNEFNTVSEKIQSGLFPFGSKSGCITTLPKPHENFTFNISSTLQDLFILAFENGHYEPEIRPTLETWGKVIYSEIISPTYPFRIKANQLVLARNNNNGNSVSKTKYEKIKGEYYKIKDDYNKLKNTFTESSRNHKVWLITLIILSTILTTIIFYFHNNLQSQKSSTAQFRRQYNDLLNKSDSYQNQIASLTNEKNRLSDEIVSLKGLNNKLENKVKSVSPFSIINIDFSNNGSSSFKNSFYSFETTYLYPRLSYESNIKDGVEATLYFKYFFPNGKLLQTSDSPYGYTFNESFSIPDNYAQNVLEVDHGIGYSELYKWPKGRYKVEVWYKSNPIYNTFFEIK
ncbi:cell division protein FtsB [Catalinimonas alkaloidigena]|uniref:protein kinase domain-containing protein n=1 Tax=Catalinimonas alkaloidigena TaxID=1075417 RepID=UPI00240506D5|nr:hypothetical protein [Catalinimonas alkaloidigena]MDF9800552.1 cell division protein FtsB [Catalinimonas alkaloidigena]